MDPFTNPFRPGAGHPPPFLAGRRAETDTFRHLLTQETVLSNLVLTGLRGVGKTVLLDTFRPIAHDAGWHWLGADLSESASLTEENLVTRLLTDLASATAGISVPARERTRPGFARAIETGAQPLDFSWLRSRFQSEPGLTADKLKAVLGLGVSALSSARRATGVVVAYDEAQNLSDHAARDQFPLSLILDVFQSLQRRGVRIMLVLTGLPTLFPKLVDARTFSERMFRVVFLDRLSAEASRDAILRPLASAPIQFAPGSVDAIVRESAGYPYFLQFICREAYDAWLMQIRAGAKPRTLPIKEITAKLDADFFAGRWSRITDRQRDLVVAIARVARSGEFTVQQAVEGSRKHLAKPFSASHVSQMLNTLAEAGLVYKNRHGKYSFAVPLFGEFVLRAVDDQ